MNTLKLNAMKNEKLKDVVNATTQTTNSVLTNTITTNSVLNNIAPQSPDHNVLTHVEITEKTVVEKNGSKRTEDKKTLKPQVIDDNKENPKKKATVEHIRLNLVSDSENSNKNTIIKAQLDFKSKMLEMRSRLGSLDTETKKQWRKSEIYLSLSKKAQEDIEKNNDLKKMYLYVSSDNINGLNNMLSNGHIYPDMINMNNGFALKIAANNGSVDMLRTLCGMGGNAYAVDPKNCFSQEVAKAVVQERYKIDHATIIHDNFSMPKPRY